MSGIPSKVSTGAGISLGADGFSTSSGTFNAGTTPPTNGAVNVDAATYGGTFLSAVNTSGSSITMSVDATTNTLTVNGNVVVTGTVAEAAVSEGPLTITGGTVTTNTPFLQATQSWNAGGVTFTGLKVNITDTASAAGSLLMDYQVGGVSKFSVSKAGNASVAGTLSVTGVATLTAQPILSSLTASQAVFTDSSKGLVSNAITGSGNVVMSASPTLTGTIGAASMTLSGTLGVTGLATLTAGDAAGLKILQTGQGRWAALRGDIITGSSSADVLITAINYGLVQITNASTGAVCLALFGYGDVTTIIAQINGTAGAEWVTAAPAAGQSRVYMSGGSVYLRSGSSRNTNTYGYAVLCGSNA